MGGRLSSTVREEVSMHILDDFATLKSLEPYPHRTKRKERRTVEQIEQWITESLQYCAEEGLAGAGGTVGRKGLAKPMEALEIDRVCLKGLGLSSDAIDSIYRALYVNTKGFFHALTSSVEAVVVSDQKQGVLARLWKAFQALLQRCCLTEFAGIVQVLVEEKEQAIVEA